MLRQRDNQIDPRALSLAAVNNTAFRKVFANDARAFFAAGIVSGLGFPENRRH